MEMALTGPDGETQQAVNHNVFFFLLSEHSRKYIYKMTIYNFFLNLK